MDSTKHTAQTIASEYTLDEERVSNILRYFKMFEVQFPSDSKAHAMLKAGKSQKILADPRQST